jgi:large subunit ribosomal protein L24
MQPKLKVKKGDTVVVIAGKDKGRSGEVLKVIPTERRVVVEGVNMVTKHKKQRGMQQSGIERMEAAVHVSNVLHVDPKDGGPTRVGYTWIGEGDDARKVRVAKRSGEILDK